MTSNHALSTSSGYGSCLPRQMGCAQLCPEKAMQEGKDWGMSDQMVSQALRHLCKKKGWSFFSPMTHRSSKLKWIKEHHKP